MATREELLARRKQKVDERNQEYEDYILTQSAKREWYSKDVVSFDVEGFLIQQAKTDKIDSLITETQLNLPDLILQIRKKFGLFLLSTDINSAKSLKDLSETIYQKSVEYNILLLNGDCQHVKTSQSSKIVSLACINLFINKCSDSNREINYSQLSSLLVFFFGESINISTEQLIEFNKVENSTLAKEILYHLSENGFKIGIPPRIITKEYLFGLFQQCWKSRVSISLDAAVKDCVNLEKLNSLFLDQFQLEFSSTELQRLQYMKNVDYAICYFLSRLCSKEIPVEKGVTASFFQKYVKFIEKKEKEEHIYLEIHLVFIPSIPGGLILWGGNALFDNFTTHNPDSSLTWIGWIAWIVLIIGYILIFLGFIWICVVVKRYIEYRKLIAEIDELDKWLEKEKRQNY